MFHRYAYIEIGKSFGYALCKLALKLAIQLYTESHTLALRKIPGDYSKIVESMRL